MTPEDLVERLAHLARNASDESLTRAPPAGLQRLERTLARRAAARRRARVGGLTLAAVLCCATSFWLLRDRALTFQVEHGRVGADGYIVCDATTATVRFSDESQFGMDPSTRLRVSRVNQSGAVMMLEGGAVDVHIHRRPRASWSIDVGPYVVHVTGTEFHLAWRVVEQTLDLHLREGKVTVEGPLAGGAVRLEAGQHLIANATESSVSIFADVTPMQAPLVNSVEASTSSVMASSPPPASAPFPPTAAPSADTPRATRPPTGESSGWTARVARGDFEGVVEDATRRGVERTLAEARAGDLAALATSARYAHKPDLARRALLAERTRFPGSTYALDAAFFLGGLAESAGDDATALTWNETYDQASPNGTYAAQALGRTMILVGRLQGAEAARGVATDYVRRFPDGPYSPLARQLLRSP